MKIAVVHQNDLRDCGCACLSSIIKYYNGYIPIEKIRLDTYTDTGGTSAYNLIEAAKKYGFDAIGKRINVDALKGETLPLIAHVQYPDGLSHYIVIYKIYKNKLLIMDPARGKTLLKKEDFLNIWTNIVIIFHPKNQIPKFDNNESIFKKFFKYLINPKNKFIYFVLINTLITILTIFGGFYFSISIKYYKNKIIYNIIIIFLVILILRILLNYIRGKIQNIINYLLDTQIIGDFVSHIFNLPLNFMQTRTSGEIISRVSELNNIKHFFSELTITIFWDSLLAISSLIITMIINLRLGLIGLIVSVLYGVIAILNSKSIYKNIREIIEKDSEYNELLIEDIKMYESIINIDGKNYIIGNLSKKLTELSNISLIFNNKQNIINALKNIIYEISLFASITLGLTYLIKNKISLDSLILYENFINIYWQYFQNIINEIPKYYYLKASFEKISDFYNIKMHEKNISQNFKSGDIVFNNITINYYGKNNVIKNFNCTIKEGNITLLRGPTGTGKSSLLKCLLLNNQYTGDIKISNINIKDYSKETLQKNIIYVGQNENLFTGTIYDNIVFGRTISIKELYKISEICLVNKIIDKKALRYNTTINTINNNLSGGERQRIILARALLSKSNIIILDEALSEVDQNTEINILKNIQSHFHNKTIIYVSHKNVECCFKNQICLKK